jgi:hypothetical protein
MGNVRGIMPGRRCQRVRNEKRIDEKTYSALRRRISKRRGRQDEMVLPGTGANESSGIIRGKRILMMTEESFAVFD